jgi:hypothetical protein
MTYEHRGVYVVRVVDTDETWFVGPYGSTRAGQVANRLKTVATGRRQCHVEPLAPVSVGTHSRSGGPRIVQGDVVTVQ